MFVKAASAIAAVVVAVAPVAVPHLAHGPAVPPVAHHCEAHFTINEDQTWNGGRLYYDGKLISNDWTRHMVALGFAPTIYNGTACTYTLD